MSWESSPLNNKGWEYTAVRETYLNAQHIGLISLLIPPSPNTYIYTPPIHHVIRLMVCVILTPETYNWVYSGSNSPHHQSITQPPGSITSHVNTSCGSLQRLLRRQS